MAFERPTLQEINSRIQADFNGRLTGAESRLRRSMLGIFARVLAGAFHGLYGYIAYLARQLLPDTATGQWLRRHAAIWGVMPHAASRATGLIDLSGINGAVVPAGTELQRADGAIFVTQAEATLTGGVAGVAVTAALAGAAGVTPAGAILSFVSPVSGIQSQALVGAAGLSGGADEETDEALRRRILLRIKNPAYGGNAADYERWALEVAGVTRVWVYPQWYGLGTVGVSFVCDGRADIIPTAGDIAAVTAYIQSQRPVTASVLIFAPIASITPFRLSVTPDTSAVREAIIAELDDLFYRVAEPGGTILISHIRQAISNAAGEEDHALTAPANDVVAAAGYLPVRGAVTWL